MLTRTTNFTLLVMPQKQEVQTTTMPSHIDGLFKKASKVSILYSLKHSGYNTPMRFLVEQISKNNKGSLY